MDGTGRRTNNRIVVSTSGSNSVNIARQRDNKLIIKITQLDYYQSIALLLNCYCLYLVATSCFCLCDSTMTDPTTSGGNSGANTDITTTIASNNVIGNNNNNDDDSVGQSNSETMSGTTAARMLRRQISPPKFGPSSIFGLAPGPPPGPNSIGPFGFDRIDEVCGLSMSEMRPERIVGGRSTHFGEVPFVVHLRESQLFRVLGFNKCGGVLINHKWALTAGHCKPAFYSSLEVILGKYKTFEDAPPPNGTALSSIASNLISSTFSSASASSTKPNIQDNLIATTHEQPIDKKVLQMLADTVIVHPDYDQTTLENDIALIKLKHPVPYREDIQPICLPFIDEEFAGLDGYATGWGLLDFDKRQLPENLQIVRLPIMANKRCQSLYKKAGHSKKITDHDLCAGYAKGGKDACEGDSGGPLIVRRPHDQRWVLAGIVSNGVKCGEPLLPGVYTRVSKFIPWIREQISIHS